MLNTVFYSFILIEYFFDFTEFESDITCINETTIQKRDLPKGKPLFIRVS